ncbi:hypothetical protein GGQ74_002898 [Desulfobaculum xiamenense]|uniref:WbqC-like protein family protein n=1 Tax=Desulfobaculum xiamenense TaxID=995050 RepID=A0A846QM69_9BACT|nr:WbqC family protein [Desulfobaculum xiamenense]NJB69201.1 hypothetical protein [Desulfobaculum xiamenense]
MGLSVSIQQPEHAPWLGFFHKMDLCAVTVLFDTVQYKKRYFENRNRIRTREGWQWVTVPVVSRGRFTQRIADVDICGDATWRRKYLGAIAHNYCGTPFHDEIFPSVRAIVEAGHVRLADLNIALIDFVRNYLGMGGRMVRASALPHFDSHSTGLLLDICLHLNATDYVCGVSGPDYMDMALFDAAGVAVRAVRYESSPYTQAFPGFEPGMSVLDALFNHGPATLDILRHNAADAPGREETTCPSPPTG